MSLLLRTMQQLSFAGARFATGTALVQARPAQRRCLATAAKASDKGLGKGDLIKAVAAKTGLKEKQADEAVNAVLDIIESTVAQGKKVTIPGFGSFEARHRAARAGRNPKTGETLQIAATTVPAFSAGKGFKDAVKNGGQ